MKIKGSASLSSASAKVFLDWSVLFFIVMILILTTSSAVDQFKVTYLSIYSFIHFEVPSQIL